MERLVPSVVELVRAGQVCPHTAQEIARLPEEAQQTFAGKVVTQRLAKSAVERLVSAYNNPNTPQPIKQSALENPQFTLAWLAQAEKSHSVKTKDDGDPKSLLLQKLRNILALLCRLSGEAEGILLTLPDGDKQHLSPTLSQCAQVLLRFTRFAENTLGGFSLGKQGTAEVVEREH